MSGVPCLQRQFCESGKVLILCQSRQLNDVVETLPPEPVLVEADRDLFLGGSMSVGNRTLIEGRVSDGTCKRESFGAVEAETVVPPPLVIIGSVLINEPTQIPRFRWLFLRCGASWHNGIGGYTGCPCGLWPGRHPTLGSRSRDGRANAQTAALRAAKQMGGSHRRVP